MTTSIFPGVCAVAWKAAQSRQSALVCFSGSGGREKCLLAQDALQKPTLPASPCVILAPCRARHGPGPARTTADTALQAGICRAPIRLPCLDQAGSGGVLLPSGAKQRPLPGRRSPYSVSAESTSAVSRAARQAEENCRPRGPCELGRPDDKPGLRRRPGPRFPSWTAEARAYFSVTVPCRGLPW